MAEERRRAGYARCELTVREYGDRGPEVIVLHGGPGAIGQAAPLARALAGDFRVFEPWQRPSGGARLTVAAHVADLHSLVAECLTARRPALVGHSWGAMLALAYAAEHPGEAGPLVLVGCGTFDTESRTLLEQTVESRLDEGTSQRFEQLEAEERDADEYARRGFELLRPVYAYDIDESLLEPAESVDIRAQRETWDDMVRLQTEGVYPAAFARIGSPVFMVHGETDPHPGVAIRDSLAPFLDDLEYRELPRCGHEPWLERHAREEFLAIVREWLRAHTGDDAERRS